MPGMVRRPWRFVTTFVTGTVLRRGTGQHDLPEARLDRAIADALVEHAAVRAEVADAVTRQQRSSIRLHARLAAAERASADERTERIDQVIALLDEVIEDTFQVHDRRDHLARMAVDLREGIIAAAADVDDAAQVERREQLTAVMRTLSETVGDDVPLPAHLDERVRSRLARLDRP